MQIEMQAPKETEMQNVMKSNHNESDKLSKDHFSITIHDIVEVMDKYDHRTANEELTSLEKLGTSDQIVSKLKSNIDKGISDNPEEIIKRIESFGSNKLEEEEMKHCCEFVLEALGDLMLQILIVAAIVQTVLGATVSDEPTKDWIDGISIIIAVVCVVTVGSVTNYQKEKKFRELNEKNNDMKSVTIKRNGQQMSIQPDQILVGDVVSISSGMILPADGILIRGNGIKMDESALTGESELISKETLEECIAIQQKLLDQGKKIEKKNTLPSPVLLSGTTVDSCSSASECTFLMVIAVGANSANGKIRELVKQSADSEDSKTPLEEKLDVIAGKIGYFGLFSAIITLVALFIRFGVDYSSKDSVFKTSEQTKVFMFSLTNNTKDFENNSKINNLLQSTNTDPKSTISKSVLDIFLLCVAIVVVAIPEGLPLAVTLALAFSIKKMMKENNLVRKMQACETMGGANYICTDKTGTLTKNIMSIVNVYDCDKIHDLEELVTSDPKIKEDPLKEFNKPDYYNLFKLSIALNIEASLNIDQNTQEDIIIKANKSDLGFINLLHKFGEKIAQIRNKYLGSNPKTHPFTSKRKRMSTAVKSSEFPTGYRLFIKGASDILLEQWATHYIDPNTNEKKTLTDAVKTDFVDRVINSFASMSLRTIVICYKDISEYEFNNFQEKNENDDPKLEIGNLIVIAVVGIKDSLKNGVADAVLKCHDAGVKVIMVTGDLKETAVAIAKKCNILEKNLTQLEKYQAITGEEFYNEVGGLLCETCSNKIEVCKCPRTKSQAKKQGLPEDSVRKDKIANEEKLKQIIKSLSVIARCRPMDKYALVVGLRKLNNVVAVTGDGTNDAPALSRSDVGFAMGQAGTDIAKEASDIIILDDNFASIVTAILWGRNIYDNIRKFIQFQLTVNLCACVLVFITACIGNETPLKPIQMLWVNLIMDSLGSLALATEAPHEDLLKRKPYSRNESIISARMWKHILIQSMVELGILLFLYLYAPYFIMEDYPARIAESDIINRCYGTIPGNLPFLNSNKSWVYYIIHGSKTNWNSDSYLISSMSAQECGNYAERKNLLDAYKLYNSSQGGTTHMTIVFNTFVLYTLLNQINARIIDDNLNVFARIFENPYFLVITGIEFALQIILIEFGSNAFKVVKGGLTGQQWGICIGFAFITFIVNFIAKLLPLEGCIDSCLNCFGDKSNKVANINENQIEEPAAVIKENNQQLALNVMEPQGSLKSSGSGKRNSSMKKDAGFISNLRSKSDIHKAGSIKNIRGKKDN